jgi:hypothetical protein
LSLAGARDAAAEAVSAAARVAESVAAVAAAAAMAARAAATLIGEQLAEDVAAAALAVAAARPAPKTLDSLALDKCCPDSRAGDSEVNAIHVLSARLLTDEDLRRLRDIVDDGVTATLRDMHQQGASPHTIAAALNAGGARTDRGLRWSGHGVRQMLARQDFPDVSATLVVAQPGPRASSQELLPGARREDRLPVAADTS